MGAIARNAANNITTSGVFTADAITNASVTGITVLANAEDGITLISSQTASASASISFTTGIDSTYKAYKFVFSNMHPSSNEVGFQFQANQSGQTGFNEIITSTVFKAFHFEDGSDTSLTYRTGSDQAQGTGYQTISEAVGSDNDQTCSGYLQIFNPSSTTFVKHFIAEVQTSQANDGSGDCFTGGYINVTGSITEISFKFSSGNIDDGTIYLYGIK
jgi:hypothetical protein